MSKLVEFDNPEDHVAEECKWCNKEEELGRLFFVQTMEYYYHSVTREMNFDIQKVNWNKEGYKQIRGLQ